MKEFAQFLYQVNWFIQFDADVLSVVVDVFDFIVASLTVNVFLSALQLGLHLDDEITLDLISFLDVAFANVLLVEILKFKWFDV